MHSCVVLLHTWLYMGAVELILQTQIAGSFGPIHGQVHCVLIA